MNLFTLKFIIVYMTFVQNIIEQIKNLNYDIKLSDVMIFDNLTSELTYYNKLATEYQSISKNMLYKHSELLTNLANQKNRIIMIIRQFNPDIVITNNTISDISQDSVEYSPIEKFIRTLNNNELYSDVNKCNNLISLNLNKNNLMNEIIRITQQFMTNNQQFMTNNQQFLKNYMQFMTNKNVNIVEIQAKMLKLHNQICNFGSDKFKFKEKLTVLESYQFIKLMNEHNEYLINTFVSVDELYAQTYVLFENQLV